MDLGLKGKKVILTGGSRGLGRAALDLFAEEGCDVAFFSRDADQVAETAKHLESHGGRVFGSAFTLDDIEAYKAWLDKAAKDLGGVDIFVHNVSASGAGVGSDWNATLQLDIMGAVAAFEALEPYLEKSDAASVVLMSSTAALETFLSANAFNALKAALITYAKQQSQALGPKGIRVNVVSPGPISFPGGNWEKIKAARPELFDATAAKMVTGRFGTAEEVARSVVFIASPASSNTTGANLVVDGGYTKRVQF
ncbi:3-ketoacyl-ACP reductase [Sphingobium lactosutens]|mgnify:FL=1|uniref:SDR family NAD(P)-dependent oxidoreductase n=1 Tax=Sphingobium lactosutens TaxID=522773 RepID=UPI0015BC4656|nr:SDR family oxidoreductase [Sphingobium lactosutens]NWK99126.1 3-ketoacyl-ACP reductase [Sphingobium lactosutens]